MPSIQDRLKKLPPFDDDIPMLKTLKEVSTQQSQKPPVEEKPQEEVIEPVEEKKEEEKVDEVVEEVKEEALEEPTEEKVEEKVVEEPKDRTKEQFDKLTEHNKQLKEENQKLYTDVLSSLKPEEPIQEFTPEVFQQVEKHTTELPQAAVDDIYANLIDKDGYIDPELLIKTLREANESATQAHKEAAEANKRAMEAETKSERKFRDFEETREVRAVHKKYPQIDPKSDKFNDLFWDDVRKEIATAPILRGENVSFMDATDKIWNERYATKEEVVEVDKKEKQVMTEKEDAKKNINATTYTSSVPSRDYASSDTEALKAATIKGIRGSIAERLRRAGQ